ITLVALAIGYWAGGKLANSRNISAANLLELYGLMPAVAALFIVAACLIYPFVFAPLAAWSVVAGAFGACLILLAAPLIAASAMNPLLVAITRHDSNNKGDGGSGQVFFVSTIGSVAGVLVTAFGLIPFLSNYDAVLIVAAVLAALGLAVGVFAPEALKRRSIITATSILGLLASLVLLWQADAYTGRSGAISYQGGNWRIEASFRSLFGTVKIIKKDPDAHGQFRRVYFQDGLTQNAVESNGRSHSFYTYALEALAVAYRPDARQALALGLGAGMTPARLAARGINTEIVEIDPASLKAARRFFNLDEQKTPVYQTDARTFVHHCPRTYDVVVVDLFHGDGTPDYLITRDFFRDLRRCLNPDGVAVFNTFADLRDPVSYAHLMVTLRSELPHIALYRPFALGATHSNSFIVAGATALPAPAKVTMDAVPPRHEGALWDMLATPLPLVPLLFEGGKIITDARNRAALDLARMQRSYRQAVVGFTPPEFLLN
ncbi:MAG TPA: fused MFS/spermidine synthase, partial [Burkholderiales bacterium]|nr:fused MFS/spermidine synthase [Burkholderiales bacterium]